jgi:2-polyprenyl-3-methyl-5-hydroxy-6-metoxy-1,4-benzoquinol methylase
VPDWFANEALWADLFPFEFGETAITAGETQVERVIALSGVERGDVLDLACGPGRHAVPLAKRGLRVTGVDLSASTTIACADTSSTCACTRGRS